MPFASGENVGPYRIIEKLGSGGMATVFKAYHPALDRYVALKVLHPAFREDPNFLARFQREARIVARLEHPRIVPIYDFSEHEGHPYLVMRFLEGETLKARFQRGKLPLEEVLRIGRAVAEALTYAHDQSVLHRDIKPSNVFLTPEGGIFLTDFGLARMAEAGESTLSRDMMVGTPAYISPEQAKGETDLDVRTDVYSFGVVLYELLVGRVPFVADTPYSVIHDHIFTPLPLPRKLNPELSEPMERVLLKALAKEREDRYQSVAELIAALEEAASATPTVVTVPAERPVERPRRRRWWLWAAAGAALICLCLGGLLAISRLGKEGNAQRLLRQAEAAAEAGDTERALELYQQAWGDEPTLVKAYLEAGRLLLREGERQAAIQVYTVGLEANPDNAELHLAMAQALILDDNWAGAVIHLEWVMEHEPDKALPYALLGIREILAGEGCAPGREYLRRALDLEPDLPEAHFGLGLCYVEEQRPEDWHARAWGEFQQVIHNPETSPWLLVHAQRQLEDLRQMQPVPTAPAPPRPLPVTTPTP